MCRLFPCIPIFRGFFLIKKCKKMCMCVGVKNRTVTYDLTVIGLPGSSKTLLILFSAFSKPSKMLLKEFFFWIAFHKLNSH